MTELACVVLLVIPPAYRIARHAGHLGFLEAEVTPDEAAEALREARLTQQAAQEDLLRRTEAELATLERIARRMDRAVGTVTRAGPAARLAARYRVSTVDVVPFCDPSPTRQTLWVALGEGGSGALSSDAAVISTDALASDALVGRLVESPAILPLGRVQTLLDPHFRVRFSAVDSGEEGEVTGLLRGTERRVDGRPLLEAFHLTSSRDLAPGTAIVTAGGDGIFPPGLVIGEVIDAPGSSDGGGVTVRAAASPDDLEQVVVLTDVVRRAFASQRESR